MMRKILVFAIMAVAHVGFCRAELCGTSDLVPGKGWVHKDVPCSELERPIPCSKEWTDEKGYWHIETIPCPPGHKQKTYEQVAREEAAAKRKQCGKDYQVLRVGMSFARYQQCWEEPAFVTETVVKGGVVETYRATFYWIHVQNDRIVSYTRRTR